MIYVLVRIHPFSKEKTMNMLGFYATLYLALVCSMIVNEFCMKIPLFTVDLKDSSGKILSTIPDTNLTLFAILLVPFTEVAFFKYFKYHKLNTFISFNERPGDSIMNFRKILNLTQGLISSFKEYEHLIFKGMLEKHIRNCVNPFCFCKKEAIFDSNKGREFLFAKKSMHRNAYGKQLVKE